MKNVMSITIKLLVLTVVCAAFLGAVYSITKDPIDDQIKKTATEARLAAFPDAVSFKDSKAEIPKEYSIIKNVFYALDKDGNIIGATFGINTRGYSPGLMMTVGIAVDGKIKGVVIGDNTETPTIGKKALASGFLNQFTGKPYDKPLQYVRSASSDYDIQAVSGATVTTKGVTNAVNIAIEFYKQLGGAK